MVVCPGDSASSIPAVEIVAIPVLELVQDTLSSVTGLPAASRRRATTCPISPTPSVVEESVTATLATPVRGSDDESQAAALTENASTRKNRPKHHALDLMHAFDFAEAG